jgi:hypothetical protein
VFLFTGLPLCVLSKNTNGVKKTRPAFTPPPSAPPAFEPSAGSESLLSVVLNGDVDTALTLIEEGANVNAEDQHGKKSNLSLPNLTLNNLT